MLGTEVAPRLASEFEVVAADVAQFDITDSEATSRYVKSVTPTVLVNCAAYTDVDRAEGDADAAFAVNATGAGNLAAAATAVGAKLVHVSTDYVFDGKARDPYGEDDEPCPLGVYGRSKLEGERAVFGAASDALVVRTAWLYGHAGANFVEKMIALASSGVPLRVVDDQVGSPTNAKDLAGAIAELIAVGAAGVVNATNAGVCSWYEFALEVFRLAGLEDVSVSPVSTEEFPRPAPRPAYSVLSLERLTELTGGPPREWGDALAEYIAER
jgi:dTDP-4-dehydrorhamnose reductase